MRHYERKISSELIYNGKIIKVKKDTIELENGKIGYREVVLHNGGACAVVKTNDNCILFVKQYRYPFQEVTFELPAGKINAGESPDETIIRELQEEVGIFPIELISMGLMYSSPGFTNEKIYFYYTDDYTLSSLDLDDDEFLDIEKISIDDVYKYIEDGTIVDAKSLCLLLKCKERLIKL